MSETLQTIRPDKEQTYNGLEVSLGIAPILSTLSNLSNVNSRPLWTLFLINVETIIRDRKDDNQEVTKLAQAVLQDCSVLAQYIAAYCRHTLPPQFKEKPIVCFYMAHYEKLPQIFLKDKFPKGTERRWEVRDEIERILNKQGWQDTYDETQVVFEIAGAKGEWPHKQMLHDLSKAYPNLRYRKVLMVSHVPLDFHLYRAFAEFTILESYTGALKQKNQLGVKVFNEQDIPFCKYTGLILGDKWYLKSLIKPAIRKRLREQAAKERWNFLPDREVLARLMQATYLQLPSDVFVKPDI